MRWSTKTVSLLLGPVVFSTIWAAPCLAADYGLTAPQPIGPYLDGVFPTQVPGGTGDWGVQQVFAGINPKLITCATPVPGTNKILIVEKQGRILTFDNTPDVDSMQMFLDMRAVVYNNSDSGMSNLVFHPEFGQPGSPNRGYVYITYKTSPDGDDGNFSFFRLSRFTVPDGTLVADPGSELILISQFDRHQWHDSGCMMFGPDGFLYLAVGDEGGADDEFDVTQQINNRLFSGMLRIDVDQNPARSHAIRRHPQEIPEKPDGWPADFTGNYMIPNDNPWVNEDGSVLEEFYAIGLRSPYRFSRDPETGRVWMSDVGEHTREEVSELVKGGNFEWAFKEGTEDGLKPMPDPLIGTRHPPVWDYSRDDGFCGILGYFYHGNEHPNLVGKCIVADYVSGKVWALTPAVEPGGRASAQYLLTMSSPVTGTHGTTAHLLLPSGEPLIIKFTEDERAQFFKLVRTGVTIPNPPALLSETGAFTNLATLTPRAGLIPYAVNSPLWSDRAEKQRWIAVPNDGTHDTAAEKIKFLPEADWQFPAGTVFVKHFDLPIDMNNSSTVRRLETRFLIMTASGEPYGVTYRWRPDGSDADLLSGGAEDIIPIALEGGGSYDQKWTYPSRTSCMTCHNGPANYVLGVKTHQLNRDFTYLSTGGTANQLATFAHLGMFDDGYRPEQLPYFLKSSAVSTVGVPLETRVRSYIDANCAQCHRPGGVSANFDARFTTPLVNQNLIRGEVNAEFTGEPESVMKPMDPFHSIAYRRIYMLGTEQMPPLGRNLIDTQAVDTIRQWLQSLSDGPTVTLKTQSFTAEGDAIISVTFSSSVTDFTASDVYVRGGEITVFSGTGNSYTLRVHPTSSVPVVVKIPAAVALGNDLPNYASAKLETLPLPSDLVTWLKLDARSGGTAKDSSIAANDGEIAGDTTWADGFNSGALEFDGGRITIPNHIGTDFTISFWIRPDEPFPTTNLPNEGSNLFFGDAPGPAEEFLIGGTRSAGGVNRINFQTGSTISGNRVILQGGRPVPVGQWTHVAIRRTKAIYRMEIYVNGQFDARVTGGGEDLTLSPTIEIGGSVAGAAGAFHGKLDQIRIYDRVLTDMEVQKLADETYKNTTSPIDLWFADHMPGLFHLHDESLDPDGDGLSIGGEFALHTDPIKLDTPPISVGANEDGSFNFSYPVRSGASGLGYVAQVSFDLKTWQPMGDRFTDQVDTPTADPDYLQRTGKFRPHVDDPQDAAYFRVLIDGAAH
jgi:uncharacterized repeat protein (TIGR03806 family)